MTPSKKTSIMKKSLPLTQPIINKKEVKRKKVIAVAELYPASFVVMAVDYFTKWVEAEAMVKITTTNITRYLLR